MNPPCGPASPATSCSAEHNGGTASEQQRGESLDERLAEEIAHPNTESDLIASDIGLDGAGASAEEAAMHLIPDSESY
ncbi:DUF5709 domain-containing protein [Streptomyces sp. SAS_270]|uniref:DUF5709 domain-containing protein n=1 Tax=Streptomyces sp. SAS_270 TaxID=3412748 RepID=UPI00403C4DE0